MRVSVKLKFVSMGPFRPLTPAKPFRQVRSVVQEIFGNIFPSWHTRLRFDTRRLVQVAFSQATSSHIGQRSPARDLPTMFDRFMSSVARRAAIPFYGYQYRGFLDLLQRARERQREWLFARIRRCRNTRFGRDHGFASIRTVDDFRRQVPVARYDHFAPYINAVASGDFAALFPPDDQVLRFTITTGSTGVPKLNPVTESWLKEYRNAWNMWGVKTLLDHPAQVGGKILQMAGTWNMGRTPVGIPISM